MTTTQPYQASIWERIIAVVCAVAILGLVFILVLRKEPFTDPNKVVLIRIVLSMATAIIGAVIPGFLNVGLTFKGVAIRSGGALALFVITYFFTPTVLPLSKLEENTEKTKEAVNRIATKFDAVFVQAIFELPDERLEIKALKKVLNSLTNTVIDGKNGTFKGLSLSYISKPVRKSGDTIVTEQEGKPTLKISLNDILDKQYIQLQPDLIKSGDLVSFLMNPHLNIGINREGKEPATLLNSLLGLTNHPDLNLSVHEKPCDPDKGYFSDLIFDPNKNKLMVSWNGFEYPSTKWATNRKILSIEDLDKSQLLVMLSNWNADKKNLDSIAAMMRPIWFNLKFDNNFVTFTQFNSTALFLKYKIYYNTFPSSDSILQGYANHNPELAYSLGGF